MSTLALNLHLRLVDGLSRPITAGRKALGGFAQTVGGLQSRLSGLSRQQDDVAKFRELKRSTLATRQEFSQAQTRVNSLARELNSTSSPSAKLSREFQNAKQRAQTLNRTLERQDRELEKVRRSLSQTGISTRDLGSASRQLRSDIDSATNALERKARAAERLELANDRMQKGLQMAGNLSLAGIAAGQAGQQARRALADVTSDSIAFESAMADVKKVVEFAEPDGLQKLGASIRALSGTEISLLPEEIAAIAAAGGQMGVAEDDILDFVRTVSKVAIAYDMLPDEAGTAMAKLANMTGIPVGEIETLADAINALSDSTPSKAQEIVRAMLKVGTAGKNFGLTAQQTSALAGSFIALGKPPEVAGTAIKAILPKLQSATRQGKKFEEGLTAMGMSAADLEDAVANDAQSALTDFLATLEQLDNKSRTAVLLDMFGLEYSDDVADLAGSLDVYRLSLEKATDAQAVAGSVQREFANRSSTTENKLQLLQNKVRNLKGAIGDQLLPSIREAAGGIGRVIDGVTRWAEANPELVKGLALVATGVAAFLTVTAPVILFLSAMIGSWAVLRYSMIRILPLIGISASGLKALGLAAWQTGRALIIGTLTGVRRLSAGLFTLSTRSAVAARAGLMSLAGAAMTPATSFRQLGSGLMMFARQIVPMAIAAFRGLSLAMIANPVGLIIAGIGLAALLIWKYWKPLGAFFGGLFKGISEGLQPVLSAFSATFKPVLTFVRPVVSGLGQVIRWVGRLLSPVQSSERALNDMSSAGRRVGLAIVAGFKLVLLPVTLASKAVSVFGAIIKSIFAWSPIATLRESWSGLTSAVGQPLRGAVRMVSVIWDGIKTAFRWSPIGLVIRAWSGLVSAIGKPLSRSEALVSSIWSGVKNAFRWSPIGLVLRAWSGLASAIGKPLRNSEALVSAFWTGVKNAFRWSPIGLVLRAWSVLPDGVGQSLKSARSVASGIWNGLKEIFSWSPVRVIARGWAGLSAQITKPVEMARNAVRSVWDSLKGTLSWSPVGAVSGAWSGLVGSVAQPLDQIQITAGAVWSNLKTIASWSPVGVVARAWSGLADQLPVFSKLMDGLKSVAQAAMDRISEMMERPLQLLSGFGEKLGSLFGIGKRATASLAVTASLATPSLALDAPRPADPPAAIAQRVKADADSVRFPPLQPVVLADDRPSDDDIGNDVQVSVNVDTDDKPEQSSDGAPPERASPPASPAPAIAKNVEPQAKPAGASSSVSHVTFGDIHVHAAPGQSPQEIAEAVLRILEARQRRGLFDVS